MIFIKVNYFLGNRIPASTPMKAKAMEAISPHKYNLNCPASAQNMNKHQMGRLSTKPVYHQEGGYFFTSKKASMKKKRQPAINPYSPLLVTEPTRKKTTQPNIPINRLTPIAEACGFIN